MPPTAIDAMNDDDAVMPDAFREEMKRQVYNPWYIFQLARERGALDQLYDIMVTDVNYRFADGSHIDPRRWFGALVRTEPVIPHELRRVLVALIMRDRADRDPWHVSTFGRVECEIPRNWHAPLVRELLEAGIWVADGHTCPELEHPRLFGDGRPRPAADFLVD